MGCRVGQLNGKSAITKRHRESLGRGGWGLAAAFIVQSTAVCDNFFSDLDCRNPVDNHEKKWMVTSLTRDKLKLTVE